ncbi:hypothetical protein QVD17_37575 [Tagetes erecta]|uniref:Uncharacterized protein n=1 Tax=Tagetes erecta TaxID=13708 RepID=A0AAD8NJZ5_TARER|nr:hypothetical protein QVD17_37575 [Tagetes erecta]
MCTRSSRNVTFDEIDRVKYLIEQCILQYMKKKQVIDVLHQQHNIEPCVTKIIWQHLEKQNKSFFKNYYLRLAVLDQVNKFDYLVEKEAEIINQLCHLNGSNIQPSGLNDCGPLGLQHASDHPFTVVSAQDPNVGNSVQSPINDESGVLSATCYMGSNPHQLQRTFTDELSAFLFPHPVEN